MPKNIPSLRPQQLIRILKRVGCTFYREGKGDHCLYRLQYLQVFMCENISYVHWLQKLVFC